MTIIVNQSDLQSKQRFTPLSPNHHLFLKLRWNSSFVVFIHTVMHIWIKGGDLVLSKGMGFKVIIWWRSLSYQTSPEGNLSLNNLVMTFLIKIWGKKIVHNKTNNIHLENKWGEISFNADFNVSNLHLAPKDTLTVLYP